MKFALVKIVGESEEILFQNRSYEDLNNKRIWVETINANTTTEINNTYRLYMWIDKNTVIGNVNQDYTLEEWNDVFASIKVEVNGDLKEKEIIKENLVELVKSKVGTDGVVAVNTDGDLYDASDATQAIRDYRYSGNDVNNYVTFNDEIWRIIGVFKDTVKDETGKIVLDSEGNPTYEEKIKLVRNTTLNSDEIPMVYVENDMLYYLKLSDEHPDVYWDHDQNGDGYSDWHEAGLQYFLNNESDSTIEFGYGDIPNFGYLSLLSPRHRKLLSKTTYHIGETTRDDSAKLAYNNERKAENITGDNQATWDGLIGLLSPSDYGYAASPSEWDVILRYDYVVKDSQDLNWMYTSMGHSGMEWILAPSGEYASLFWDRDGDLVLYGGVSGASLSIRPVLYLKTDASVLPDGDVTIENPYQIIT